MKTSLGIIAVVFAGAAAHAQQPLQHTLPPNTLTAVNVTAHDCGDCGMHCPPGQYCTLDPPTDMAAQVPLFDVDLRDDSDKDITAGCYRVDVQYADGAAVPGQHSSFDLMVGLGLEEFALPGGQQIGPLHPGKRYHLKLPIPGLRPDAQITGVNVVPTAIVYRGGAALGDDDDLRPIFDGRQSIAREVQIWAKDVSEVKTADQLREIRDRAKADSAVLEAPHPNRGASRTGLDPNVGRNTGMLEGLIEVFDGALKSVDAGRVSESQAIQIVRRYVANLAAVSQSESVRKE